MSRILEELPKEYTIPARNNRPAMTCWKLSNGQLHREDGPAVIKAGKYEYYRYGKRHRLDGPAHIVFGTKSGKILRTSWWINGFEVTQLLRQWANRNGVDLWYLKPGDADKIEMDWCDYTTSEQRYSKETVERLKGKRHSSKSKTSSKKRKTNVKK